MSCIQDLFEERSVIDDWAIHQLHTFSGIILSYKIIKGFRIFLALMTMLTIGF